MMKIYFAGSIRGGRDDKELYEKLIARMKHYGEVLTEHIGDKNLGASGEKLMTDKEIFERDLAWLKESDIIVAEVTVPSHGVGFEIATAVDLQKQILCLFRPSGGKRLSAMISGCDGVTVKLYHDLEEADIILDEYIVNFINAKISDH